MRKRHVRCLVLVATGLVFLVSPLHAGYCPMRNWTLAEIAGAPVLVVGRVMSLEMQLEPHFKGNPKRSAPEQNMTAEITVLRVLEKPGGMGPTPAGHLRLRFVGRDGPDFGPCPRELPQIEPGQVLLLPIQPNAQGTSRPWRLIGVEGDGMTIRVAEKMADPAPVAPDGRSFVMRELVNSFRSGDPNTEFIAASRIATEADYLEPELSAQLEQSLGGDMTRWIQLLASILISYPGGSPLTLADVRGGTTNSPWPRFQAFPIAQLALRHLPEASAEPLVWRAILNDLPSLTDEPYHPLFSYDRSFALHSAVTYLSRYRGNPPLLKAVLAALRNDRPGSCYLASRLIGQGQTAYLPVALARALTVIRRPESDGDDVFASILLLLQHGTAAQRRQITVTSAELQREYPDYAAFLERKRSQETPKN